MKQNTIKKIILLNLFILFLSVMYSQNAGYMGKHLFLKYNNYTNLYFPKTNKGTVDYPFPMRHNFGMECIIHPNIVLGGFYTMGKINFRRHDDIGIIDTQGGEIALKFFPKTYAPIGYYSRIGFEFSTSEWSIAPYYSENKLKGDFSNYVASIEFGKSGIFFNRFTYTLGAQYGLRMNLPSFSKKKSDSMYPQTRMFYHHLWSMHFGIGVLLF